MIIWHESQLSEHFGQCRELIRKHGRVNVTVKPADNRSLDQNALAFAWYKQVANELREDATDDVHAYCKLHFGVPILRAEDDDFREFYDSSIKGALTYEQKLAAMKFLPVTRLMTKAQLSRYLEVVQDHYHGRGVLLQFPEAA